MRSILITGCSSGIGLDAARTLHARPGWRVFATCRKEADAERLRDEGMESFRLDYSDGASVRAALDEALARTGGTLDAVFNNGAFALPGPIEDIPREGFAELFEANVFGVHDLTRRALPVMRRQGGGRIVQCSSVLGYSALRFRGPYVASKHALEGLTNVLRLELRGQPIHVVTIAPGPITTLIRKNAQGPYERWVEKEGSDWAKVYETEIEPRLYAPDGPADTFELPPSAVTAKLIRALESRRPRARYYVTTPAYAIDVARRILPTRALDVLLARF